MHEASVRPEAGGETRYATKFHGSGTELAVIVLKNVLLSILTLGVYSFWGKVRVRQFLWQSTEFHGNRLVYHGTGKELLLGWLKVIGLFVAFQVTVTLLTRLAPLLGILAAGAGGLAVLWVIGYAVYASQRYLYSRTTWRGIRFGMEANAGDFAVAFLGGYVLTVLTLGLYAPVWQNRLYRIRMNNSRVGGLQVRFTGTDGDAFVMFIKALPLIIMTLGLYAPWYLAALKRWRAAHTWIGGDGIGAARGELTLTGGEYFMLILMNVLCILLTAGLAASWVIAHNLAFLMQRFSCVGQVDFAQVKQRPSDGSATAEGFADVLDVGFGV
jgi:uncharacterized membrane protein YjgN (DUF898 family)